MNVRQRLEIDHVMYWTPWMTDEYMHTACLRPGFTIIEELYSFEGDGGYKHSIYNGNITQSCHYVTLPPPLVIADDLPIDQFYEEPGPFGGSYTHTYKYDIKWDDSVRLQPVEPRSDYERALEEREQLRGDREKWSRVRNEQSGRKDKYGFDPYPSLKGTEHVEMMDDEERRFKDEIFRLKNEA